MTRSDASYEVLSFADAQLRRAAKRPTVAAGSGQAIDCHPEALGDGGDLQAAERRSASIHCIYDPLNPSLNAIISVARRLQELLIENNALPVGGQLPFPALASVCRDDELTTGRNTENAA